MTLYENWNLLLLVALQEGQEDPNSLTWVSLSILRDYGFSLKDYVCLKFVENECFQMTGWRFKNCVIQALGGMWWC